MSKKSVLRIIEEYLRRHPAPTEISLLDGMLKLTYTYSTPYTNSKNKRELVMPISNLQPATKLEPIIPSISYVEKENRLEEVNSFQSISTEEVHEKVFQDSVFGSAKLSKDKNRWVYVAKKKAQKNKSVFLGGGGKNKFLPDLGQTYDDVTDVGIYVWDIKQKKIVPIEIKVQGDESAYIFSYPIFANDSGSKIIVHGYKRMEFGYGILHCFNRPACIFEVTVDNLGEQNCKFLAKKLFSKHETNVFANISPCYNYMLYFGGEGYTHTYYMDLIIAKKEEGEWKETHRIKDAFVGYYDTIKSETFEFEGQSYAYFQTLEKGDQWIKRINLETGQIVCITDNKAGESFSLSKMSKTTGMIIGDYASHKFNSFFYMKNGQKPTLITPFHEQEFTLEEFHDPIYGTYLQSKNVDEEFQKQKKPLVVIAHGGPHGHGNSTINLMKYSLLKMGYAILVPSFSGSAGFGQEFLTRATGNIGETDAKQIIQLLENVLKNKEHIDRERVHVMGGSYGGYMSAIMGSRYEKYFRSAIVMNGVLSIPASVWFTDIPEWNTAETLKHNRLQDLTAEDYVKMFEQSPMSSRMKIPTLQFLGAKDRRVPYRQGLLFDAITKKTGTPIQTYVYENSAHSLADSVETIIDVAIKSVVFLEEIEQKQC